MKLKTLGIILFFSLVTNILFGQYIPIVEEEKFWIYKNYSSDYEPPQAISGHAITFLGDTVINSFGYKKVYRYQLKGWHNCPYPPCFQFNLPYQAESKSLIAFIREDTLEKKIYNLPISSIGFCDTIEHLIFDYSLAIGDTINSCIYDFIGASSITEMTAGIVDSIGTVEIFGKNRNTIFTTGFDNHFPDFAIVRILIVEGVGLERFGIVFNFLSGLFDFCEHGMEACDLIASTPSVETKNGITIFPNPTYGLVQISLAKEVFKSIRIYSTTGIFITEFLNTSAIDISNMTNGIYLLELVSENNERMITKIVKYN